MDSVTLPVGIQADIEDTFCFSQERGYQDRCHEYIDRYEVPRPWRRGNTAVQSVVEHLCERAFLAGSQMTCSDGRQDSSGSRKRSGELYRKTIDEFLGSGEQSSRIAFGSRDEANKFACGLRGSANRLGSPVAVAQRGGNVYLMREES